jgi:hypothetical protein
LTKGLPSKGALDPAKPWLYFGYSRTVNPMPQNRSEGVLVRTTVLLLLFAVAVLATAAKRGKCLSPSNPLYLFAKAAKMELVDHSANSLPVPTAAVSGIVPPQPE